MEELAPALQPPELAAPEALPEEVGAAAPHEPAPPDNAAGWAANWVVCGTVRRVPPKNTSNVDADGRLPYAQLRCPFCSAVVPMLERTLSTNKTRTIKDHLAQCDSAPAKPLKRKRQPTERESEAKHLERQRDAMARHNASIMSIISAHLPDVPMPLDANTFGEGMRRTVERRVTEKMRSLEQVTDEARNQYKRLVDQQAREIAKLEEDKKKFRSDKEKYTKLTKEWGARARDVEARERVLVADRARVDAKDAHRDARERALVEGIKKLAEEASAMLAKHGEFHTFDVDKYTASPEE